jgi:hypothetical protein
VPQTHAPGAETEVDYADLWVILRGVKTKTQLFTLRLSHSGKAAHRAFPAARPSSEVASQRGYEALITATG